MSYGILDFITLLGSLGLFLYGMKVMSEGLQKIAGERMRSILSAMTSNRVLGVLTGIVVTALIQSSSATTLMVVSFVNAGLLNLAESISVIMGANIGTTVTAWIISLLGFKVDIASFAVPLLAIAVPLFFSKKSNRVAWGEFIVGFSLLFLGLQFLKTSMPDLQSNPDALAFLQRYTDMGYLSVFIFLLIGTILTIIVQSSSATVAITLIMCSKGWIPFEMATAMVLGENIGTTITANLAALKASEAAKRTAFSHFLFNITGVCWVLIVYYPFTHLVANICTAICGDPHALHGYAIQLSESYGAAEMSLITGNEPIADPTLHALQQEILTMSTCVSIGISLFHTLFNFCNVLVLIWFVPQIERICKLVIRDKKKDEKSEVSHLKYLSPRMLSVSELSLFQVHKEMGAFGDRTLEMLRLVQEQLNAEDESIVLARYNEIEKNENICDRLEVEIVNFVTRVSEGDLSSEGKASVRQTMRAASEIESMGDSCFSMGRALMRAHNQNVKLNSALIQSLNALLDLTRTSAVRMVEVLNKHNVTAKDALSSYDIENEIDNMRDSLIQRDMVDLKAKKYAYKESVIYLDIVDECEHFGDYALNVVQAVAENKV